MAKRIVLMRNMGNSGGAWLMRTCSMHEKILMLAEINQVLRLTYVPKEKMYPEADIDFDVKIAQRGHNRKGFLFDRRTQCEIVSRFIIEQYNTRSEEVIGLIKCFDDEAIENCKGICNSVKVIQTLRNPVGIIDFYMSDERRRQTAFNEPYEECFKAHVDIFNKRFSDTLERSEAIIKLEDINISLRDNTPFYKDFMENLFEVECPDDLIEEVKEKEGYGDDGGESKVIWEGWESWKKEYFLNSFEWVVEALGYSDIIE